MNTTRNVPDAQQAQVSAQKQTPAQQAQQAHKYGLLGNLPERKVRAGGIVATVWLNKGQRQSGEETEYRTISLERSYKDKEGQWQSTNSFRLNDLPKAAVVLQKTYESLILNEQQPLSGTGISGAGITGGAY